MDLTICANWIFWIIIIKYSCECPKKLKISILFINREIIIKFIVKYWYNINFKNI